MKVFTHNLKRKLFGVPYRYSFALFFHSVPIAIAILGIISAAQMHWGFSQIGLPFSFLNIGEIPSSTDISRKIFTFEIIALFVDIIILGIVITCFLLLFTPKKNEEKIGEKTKLGKSKKEKFSFKGTLSEDFSSKGPRGKIVFWNVHDQELEPNKKFECGYKNGTILVVNGREYPEIDGRLTLNSHLYDEMLIVHVKEGINEPSNNLYCINEKGEIIWRLNQHNYLGLKYRFTLPYKDKKGNLWIGNLGGKHFMIDYKNGKVLKTKYTEIDYEVLDEKKCLRINKKKYFFPVEIHQIFTFKGEFIVILLDKIIENKSNAYAFDYEGKKLWSPNVAHNFNFGSAKLSPKSDTIILYAREGYKVEVNAKTGEVVETSFTK